MSVLAARIVYTLLVGIVGVQRVLELVRSGRNERILRGLGAREHAPGQMPFMRALHATWLVGCVLEPWLCDRTPIAWVSALAGIALVVGQRLRHLAMRALGPRWNVKILTLPDAPPVTTGVFAWMRHPNYAGVVLEIAAVPLLGGAWITAIVLSVANAVLLVLRVRAEEEALQHDNPDAQLAATPRWAPIPRRP